MTFAIMGDEAQHAKLDGVEAIPAWIAPSGAAAYQNGRLRVLPAGTIYPVNQLVMAAKRGQLGVTWSPRYASDGFATQDCLFEFAPNWRLDYDGSVDRLRVMVDGVYRVQSAALVFAVGAVYRLGVAWSPLGTRLVVGTTATTDATSWGTPVLAPFLGSRATGLNCREAEYGHLVLAKR